MNKYENIIIFFKKDLFKYNNFIYQNHKFFEWKIIIYKSGIIYYLKVS